MSAEQLGKHNLIDGKHSRFFVCNSLFLTVNQYRELLRCDHNWIRDLIKDKVTEYLVSVQCEDLYVCKTMNIKQFQTL